MIFHNLILLLLPFLVVCQQNDDFYVRDENVFEMGPSNFNSIVKNTNYTTIVKFYAPWCGYCKQLHPGFSKLGKVAKDYAVQIGAVNCDNPDNKQLCAQHRVQSYPSLMVFRPPKYTHGKEVQNSDHATEQYSGERTTKSIFDFLMTRVKNYVKSIQTVAGLNKWINYSEKYKVILLSEKQKPSPLIKSLAIDFLDKFEFSIVKNPKSLDFEPIEGFPELKDVPSLVVYSPEEKTYRLYSGDMKDKAEISSFLAEYSQPLEGLLSDRYKLMDNYKKGKTAKKNKSKKKKDGKKKSKQPINDEL